MSPKFSVKRITVAAMLTAMSVIIGIFCKNFMNFGAGLFRVTFENLPIILSGFLFGPFVGGFVGVATDLISYLLSSQIYPPNLLVTLGAAVIGLVSGIMPRIFSGKSVNFKIVISCLASHLVGSVLIKSVGLYTFYGIAVLWRIPLYFVIIAIETTLLCLLYKNSNFKKTVDSL